MNRLSQICLVMIGEDLPFQDYINLYVVSNNIKGKLQPNYHEKCYQHMRILKWRPTKMMEKAMKYSNIGLGIYIMQLAKNQLNINMLVEQIVGDPGKREFLDLLINYNDKMMTLERTMYLEKVCLYRIQARANHSDKSESFHEVVKKSILIYLSNRIMRIEQIHLSGRDMCPCLMMIVNEVCRVNNPYVAYHKLMGRHAKKLTYNEYLEMAKKLLQSYKDNLKLFNYEEYFLEKGYLLDIY